MKYFVRCLRKCGQYPVTKNTFERFVTRSILHDLEQRKDAIGAELEFTEFCPRCKESSGKKVVGTVHIIKLKSSHTP